MKHIVKIVLLAFIMGIYSCHSDNKKIKVDTSGVVTHQQAKSAIDTNSSSSDVERDTLRQPLLTKVIFPAFSVKVKNCAFPGNWDWRNPDKFLYEGDTINDKVDVRNYRMWTLTTKNDSARLNTDDDNGLDVGAIEILPNNKTDKFEMSYSFKLQIVAENGKDGILWESMMPYKKIKDSLIYFFNTPRHNNAYFEIGAKIKEVKKRFNLKDTAFKKEADNRDYGIYTEHGVIFKHQLCEMPYISIIYLKIDRFSQSNLKETKYLVIDFSIPE